MSPQSLHKSQGDWRKVQIWIDALKSQGIVGKVTDFRRVQHITFCVFQEDLVSITVISSSLGLEISTTLRTLGPNLHMLPLKIWMPYLSQALSVVFPWFIKESLWFKLGCSWCKSKIWRCVFCFCPVSAVGLGGELILYHNKIKPHQMMQLLEQFIFTTFRQHKFDRF